LQKKCEKAKVTSEQAGYDPADLLRAMSSLPKYLQFNSRYHND